MTLRSWNPMSKRIEYLYLKRGTREEFMQCWDWFQKGDVTATQGTSGVSQAAAPLAAEENNANPPQGAIKGKPSSGVNTSGVKITPVKREKGTEPDETPAKKKGKPSPESTPKKTEPKKEKPEKKQVAAAQLSQKVKKEYLAATAACAEILERISTDAAWAWASPPEMTKPVINAREAVKKAMVWLSPFHPKR